MNSDEYEAPEMPLAFDDDGNPVRVEHPAVYDTAHEADDNPAETARAGVREALLEFLRDLTTDNTALQAGQYLFALAHLCGQSSCDTDAELAERMGVSASRVSHILADLPPDFTGLLRLKRRQRKRQSAMSPHQ